MIPVLTPRQNQIAQMISEAWTHKGISKKLGIKEESSRVYASALYEKLRQSRDPDLWRFRDDQYNPAVALAMLVWDRVIVTNDPGGVITIKHWMPPLYKQMYLVKRQYAARDEVARLLIEGFTNEAISIHAGVCLSDVTEIIEHLCGKHLVYRTGYLNHRILLIQELLRDKK